MHILRPQLSPGTSGKSLRIINQRFTASNQTGLCYGFNTVLVPALETHFHSRIRLFTQTILGEESTAAEGHGDADAERPSVQPKPEATGVLSARRPAQKQPRAAPPPPPLPPPKLAAASAARKVPPRSPSSLPLLSSTSHLAAAARTSAMQVQTRAGSPRMSSPTSAGLAANCAVADGPDTLSPVACPINVGSTSASTRGADGVFEVPGAWLPGRLPHQCAGRLAPYRACTLALIAMLQVSGAKNAAQAAHSCCVLLMSLYIRFPYNATWRSCLQDRSSQELVEHTLKLLSLAMASPDAQQQPSLLCRFVQTILEQGPLRSVLASSGQSSAPCAGVEA